MSAFQLLYYFCESKLSKLSSKTRLMKITFSLLISLLAIFGSAQHYKKALVTDINYTLKKAQNINSTTFPFYFHQKEFIQDVYKDIEKHLIKRFGDMEIEFLRYDSISYAASHFNQPTYAKAISKTKSSLADLYVSIESTLKLVADLDGIITYSFITKVKAFNSKGRSVYKFQSNIPFSITLDDNITGNAEIGENDFYFFYLDGLKLAFEGKSQLEPKRFISKPSFKEFLDYAYKFDLTIKLRTYYYGSDIENQKKVFEFTDEFPKNVTKGNKIGPYFDNLLDKYYIINHFNSDSLIVQLKKDPDLENKLLYGTSGLEMEILEKDTIVGNVELKSVTNIEGNLYGINFLVKRNDRFLVSEFYIDNQLRFLMKNPGRKRIIYIHKDTSEKELSQFFNLIFIHDYFVALIPLAPR